MRSYSCILKVIVVYALLGIVIASCIDKDTDYSRPDDPQTPNDFDYSKMCIRDRIDAMIKSADDSVSDQEVANIEQNACPTCGCCSGMFTANSMNCLNEAIGLALPGNGTIVATHENRTKRCV